MKDLIVTIFEDNDSLRDSFESLIATSGKYIVGGAYNNCLKLTDKLADSKPDVVLMDINMPGMNGIEAVMLMQESHPNIPVIMLTIFEEPDKVFAAICSGASGYLLKNTHPQKIIEALDEALAGGAPMTPSIAKKVLSMMQKENKNVKKELIKLSEREREVLECLVNGMSYKMIAANLQIADGTVHTHMKRIYQKLHVNSAQEAVSKAINQKIV